MSETAVLGLRFDLLSRGARDAENDLDRLGDASERTGSRVGALGKALGGAFAVTALVAGAKSAVDAFSAVEDATGAAGVQFGKALPEVLAFAEGATDSFGLSERAALDAANSFATLGKSAGLQGPALAEFSNRFTGLAADLASFKGTSTEQAIEAVGAALRGEAEPIRAYGVLLDDATLRQEALAQGLIKTTNEALNPQQKVLATQALLFKTTADAQGDFARTSESTANTQKRLQAATENATVALGEKLAPAFTAGREALLKLVQGTTGLIDVFSRVVSSGKSAVGFLNDNKAAVIALASAYTVTLIPALVRASAFAAGQLLASLAAAATGAQALALRLGAAALAAAPLLALGAVVGGVSFAILKGRQEAERFSTALKEAGATKVSDPGFAATRDQLVQTIAKLEEFGKAPARLAEARDALVALDSAVSSSNANVGLLAESFGTTNEQILKLANAAKVDLGSASFADAKTKIDAYRTATATAESSAGKLAAAQKTLGDETATTEDKVKALNDAFNAFYGVALSAQEGNDRYKASLIAATASLKENGRTLNGNTTAGLANRDAIRNVIDASQKKADADFAATGIQDRYNRILAQGREDAIRLATATGANADEVNNFRRELKLVPAKTPAALNVKINPSDAQRRLETLRRLYQGFTDKTFTIQQIIASDDRRDRAAQNRPRQGNLRGSGPALTNTRSFGGASLRTSNPGFVAAGQAAAVSFSVGFQQVTKPVAETVLKVSKDAREIAVAQMEKTLSAMAERFEGAKDRFTQARDALLNVVNLRQDLIRSVAGTLRGSVSSLFEVTSVDEVLAKLNEQKTRLSNFLFDVRNLRTRGVNTDLINQILSAGPEQAGNFAAALSTASSAQLGQVQGLQSQIAGLSGQAATSAGNATFGAQVAVARQSYEVQRVSLIELQRMVGQQERLLAETKALPVRTGQAVRAALTGAVR